MKTLAMKTQKSNFISTRLLLSRALVAALFFLTAGFAAADCGSYTPVGGQCARSVIFGWGAAGLGAQSVIALVSRPAASGPVAFQVTRISSSMGANFSGYFGVTMSMNGGPASTYTGSSVPAVTLSPGSTSQLVVSQVCFISSCNSSAPAGVVANMFSMQLTITANSGADLDATPLPLLTVQFLNNGNVSLQEQEQAVDVNAISSSARTNLNEGAANAGRYFAVGGAYTEPYTAFSVSNPSSTTPLNVTLYLSDFSGNQLGSVQLPAIPPQGAIAYLLIGRNAGDTLGLLPYSTLLPSGADGIFHGIYGVQASGPVVFLSQEFYGNSMLNAYIVH